MIVTAAAVLAATSCSLVLEDRDGCPGWLVFDLQEDCGLQGGRTASVYVFEGGETVASDSEVPLGSLRPDGYSITVPRGELDAAGVVGTERALVRGSTLSVPKGYDYDPVYLFRGSATAGEYDATMGVSLCKEHAAVEISFAAEEGSPYTYYIGIRGSTTGIDLVSGSPLTGEYDFSPMEEEAGVFRFFLPRQARPEDLVMDLYASRTNRTQEGLVESIPLQYYISRIRDFSWEDRNLKDIRIRFDLARSTVAATVGDWEDGYLIDFRI